MTNYTFLLGLQLFSIIGLSIFCIVLLKDSRNRLHTFLFFYGFSALVNSAGYLGMMLSVTEREAVLTQQIAYVGRAWVAFALLLFVFFYTGYDKRITYKIFIPLAVWHFVIYVLVLTSEYQHFFYVNRTFRPDGLFPHLVYEYGVLHHVYNVGVVLYSLFAYYMLIRKLVIDKDPVIRKGVSLVLGAVVTSSIFFVLEITGVGAEFDMNQLGYASAMVFLYIALLKCDILDTRAIARDFVIDRISEAIVAIDETGRIRFFNTHALKIFPAIETDEDGTVKRIRELFLKENGTFEQNGRKYQVKKNALVRRGGIVGHAYVFSDETERIETMNMLAEQKQLADKANKAKTDFLAHMSHDIRTPINAILGMDEMILRESNEKNITTYATDISAAGKTLLMLVNDILDLSKVEEGKMEIIPSDYEVSSIIIDLSNLIRESAAAKGLEFRLDIDKNIPHILNGDEIRIKQILLNLLNNAVKYTIEGYVSLEINVKNIILDEVTLTFTVSDTGIGIKKEDMDVLFNPFTRLDEKRNRGIEGTGLGMSIVKSLLSLMESDLSVQSEYGKGSTFSFDLKQKIVSHEAIGNINERVEYSKNHEYDYKESFHAPSARILAVDDTEVNLTVISSLLKNTEVKVDTASSGAEGIELYKMNDYDVIFLDHMMPVLDGIETLKRMKKLRLKRNTVFIALTANAISGAREMYIGAGFADYLSKPVSGASLEKTLITYLPKDKVITVTGDTDKVTESTKNITTDSTNKDTGSDTKPAEERKAAPTEVDIPGLDRNTGIKNCGSLDIYKRVLTVFCDTAKKYTDELRELFDNEDWDGYVIKIHALKSSARTVGAVTISENAFLLEKAGKSGDTDYIREHNEEVLSDYMAISNQIKETL